MAKKKASTAPEPVAFEDAMQRLEAIVRRLEDGGGTLEESLGDYGVAIGLLKSCHSRLDEAQKRVELLTGVDAEGNPISEAFQQSSSDLGVKGSQRGERRGAAAAEQPDSGGPGLF